MRARPGILRRRPIQIPGAPLVGVFAPPYIGDGANPLPVFRGPFAETWTPTGGPTGVTSPEGPAAAFDGSSTYFTSSQATTIGAAGATLVARIWVPSSFPSNSAIWGTGDLLDDHCVSLWVQGGQWAYRMGSPFSGGKTVNSSDTSYTSQWITIIGVAYSDLLEFWINGVRVNTSSGTYSRTSGETLIAGAAPTTTYFWDGKIAGALALDGPISAAMVAKFNADLWWQFRENDQDYLRWFTGGVSKTATFAAGAGDASASFGVLVSVPVTLAASCDRASESFAAPALGVSATLAASSETASSSLNELTGVSGTLAASSGDASASLSELTGQTATLAAACSDASSALNVQQGVTATLAATSADASASLGVLVLEGSAAALTAASEPASASFSVAVAVSGTLAASASDASASLNVQQAVTAILAAASADASESFNASGSPVATLAAASESASASFNVSVSVHATMAAASDPASESFYIGNGSTATATLGATSGDAASSFNVAVAVTASLAAASGDASASLNAAVGVTANLTAVSGDAAAALGVMVGVAATLAASVGDASASLNVVVSPVFVLEGVSGAAASSFSVTVTGTPVERTFLAAVRRRILDSVTDITRVYLHETPAGATFPLVVVNPLYHDPFFVSALSPDFESEGPVQFTVISTDDIEAETLARQVRSAFGQDKPRLMYDNGYHIDSWPGRWWRPVRSGQGPNGAKLWAQSFQTWFRLGETTE